MPLYEYTCRSCGTSFERRRKFDERLERTACPRCSADAESLLSAPALVGGRAESFSCAAPGPAPSSCCGGGACGLN